MIPVTNIVKLLKCHFSSAKVSRLPLLAMYSVYEMFMDIERYKGKILSPLKSHTTSDIKSGGIGDIEVLDKNGDFLKQSKLNTTFQFHHNLLRMATTSFVRRLSVVITYSPQQNQTLTSQKQLTN